MWILLGVLIGLILGLIGGFFAGKTMAKYDFDESAYDEESDTVALVASSLDSLLMPAPTAATATSPEPAAETVKPEPTPEPEAKPTAAAPQPVYDTITSSKFLTTLARQHYGVKNYWIFIYEANPQLGNPNSIRPGTRVLIPSKESFMEPTKAETDEKARRLLNALAKKYKL